MENITKQYLDKSSPNKKELEQIKKNKIQKSIFGFYIRNKNITRNYIVVSILLFFVFVFIAFYKMVSVDFILYYLLFSFIIGGGLLIVQDFTVKTIMTPKRSILARAASKKENIPVLITEKIILAKISKIEKAKDGTWNIQFIYLYKNKEVEGVISMLDSDFNKVNPKENKKFKIKTKTWSVQGCEDYSSHWLIFNKNKKLPVLYIRKGFYF